MGPVGVQLSICDLPAPAPLIRESMGVAEAGGGEGERSKAMKSSDAWKPDAVVIPVIVGGEGSQCR